MPMGKVFDQLKIDTLDILPAGVTIADQNGFFLYANDKAAEILGYGKSSELINVNWREHYRPDWIELFSNQVIQVLERDKKWDGEVEMLRTPDGSFKAHIFLTKMQDDLNCCVFYDVTEDNLMRQRLNNFRVSLDSAMDGVALLDAEGRYYYLNPQHVKLFGYEKEEELIGKTWQVLYKEDEVKRIEGELFPLLMKQGNWHGETLGVKKDGSPILQEISLTAMPGGGLICIMRDMTDLKKSEAQIRKLAAVAQNTDNLIFFTNAQHHIEWINEAAQKAMPLYAGKATNYEACDFLMMNGYMAEDIKSFAGSSSALSEGDIKSFEFKVKNKKKETWLLARVNPVYANNKIINFIYLFVDITTVKQAEESYIKSLLKEKQVNELTSGFVNIVSHEFRTPLAGMQSSIDLINLYCAKQNSISPEKLSQYIKQIQSNIDRMSFLINHILDSGRVKSGKINYEPEDFNLIQLLNDIIDDTNLLNSGKKTILEIYGESRLFHGDQMLLRQAIQNLLSNAYKFSPHSIKPPVVKVHFDVGHTDIEVIDFGIGIPDEYKPKIFQNFVRAANAENITGTGLGLSITKQFIEMNGGQISFESTVGEGTKMFMRFKQ